MGHLFGLCGPPGAGKTTLLKIIDSRNIKINQRRRLTTRKLRVEEGDVGNKSLEYEFLNPDQFAERLPKGNVASLIEWNGNYYATQISELTKAFGSKENSILLEDIPSALSLKAKYPSNVTIIFLFTADRDEILYNIDFASYKDSTNEYLVEWRRRLELKYDDSVDFNNKELTKVEYERYISDKKKYVEVKMNRAIPDLAFIRGKTERNENRE